MPVQRLIEFLDQKRIKYVNMRHSLAYTAQEIAAAAHIKGQNLAKTVMVKIDGKMAMAVLPASFQVDLFDLMSAIKADQVELATEKEFKDLFPGCEVGAMPPFGNLYGMDVYVSEELAEDEEIAFNAGSHTELLKMSYGDWAHLVKPRVLEFGAVALPA